MAILLVNFTSAITWDNVAYYRLNETSGDILDATVNNYNSNYIHPNVTQGITGKLTKSAFFKSPNNLRWAESGYVNITNDVITDNGLSSNSNITFNAWINVSDFSSATRFIYGMGTASSGEGWDGFITATSIGINIWGFSDSVNATINTNTWYMTTFIYNGTSTAIYVDGVFKGHTNRSTNLGDTLFVLGTDIGLNTNFNGTIDEVGVWNRSLNQTEITDLYNSGNGVGYQGFTGQTVVTLSMPTNDSNISDVGSNFTVTSTNITDTGYNWTNLTYYIWNSTGLFNETTVDINDTDYFNETLFIDSFILDDYIWNAKACYGNSTFSNCTFSRYNNTFEVILFSVIAESYNNATTEGSTETFTANFSFLGGYRLSELYLIYNNTRYLSSFTEYATNYYHVTRDIVIPSVGATTNITFYWEATLESGSAQNTTFHNQTVYKFALDDCSVYTNQLINMTLYDEDAQTFLDGVNQNTSIKISLNISSLDKSTGVLTYSNFFDQVNPARVCMQNGLNGSNLRIDGVIEYKSLGRFQEYYNFQNYLLNASTDDLTLLLYNLNSTSGQEFKITYKDSNFVPVSGAILDIQRLYVSDGTFKTTERPKTGAEGYTLAHLVRNDVIYNILVMKEGEIIATFENVVADCQNPLLTSCEINLNSYGSSSLPTDFNGGNDISFTLDYNSLTRTISSLFSILSGATSTVSLNVTLFDNLGNTTICEDVLISSGGALSCVVPIGFGNTTVIATLYKDGDAVGRSIIKLKEDPEGIYGNNIILISIIIFLLFVGVGASSDSPMFMGILIIVGSIVLIALNIVYSPSFIGVGATILWFIIAIIIILIKGSNRT